MCLGVPGEVVSIDRSGDLPMGRVSFGGVVKSVCLAHVPEVEVGEYVVVHVGFALTRIDADEAARVFELLEELGALEEIEEAES